jgi:MATE family multidrug resistance protein
VFKFNEWDRKTWRLVIPIVATNITIPLLGIVDIAVIGHLPGPHYLGGVAIGSLVFSIIFSSMMFLRMGTTGLTAQSLGAEDDDEVRSWFVRGVLIALVIGILLISIQIPISLYVFDWTNASDAVLPLALEYFFIRIWCAPTTLINFVILGWFLGMQNPRDALFTQVVLNGLNIVLDLWFVIGLDMGVAGVAKATLFAEVVGVTFGLWLVKRSARQLRGNWRLTKTLEKQKLLRMIRINSDIFIRSLCLQGSFFFFTSSGARQSDVILACNTILLQFTVLSAYALDAFANAAEALAGKAYGASNQRDFRSAVVASSRWALVFSLFFSLIFYTTGHMLIDVLTSIDDVRDMARVYLPWLIISPLIAVWSFQLDGIYIGATQSAAMRNTMIISMLIFYASLQVLVPTMGNHGLWLGFMIFFAIRGITLGVWYPQVEKSIRNVK